MAFLRDSIKSLVGKYYTSGSPTFGGSAPSNGASATITAGSASTTFFTWSATDSFNKGVAYFELEGSLPPGVTFDRSSGILSGQYQMQGQNTNGATYSFTVTAVAASNTRQTTTRSYTLNLSVPFKYKQIITQGYMLGGYQNGSLWSNVNRVVHSTDTTSNLGDGYVDNYHYKSGTQSRDYCYIWNGGGVTGFNMRTEVKRNSGGINFSGGNTGTTWDSNNQYSWINGEGCGQWRKWQHSSENISNNVGSGWNSHAGGFSGENYGITWDNGGYTQRITYSNDSVAGMGHSAGAHGQQKGLSSKNYEGYGGNEGNYNGGYNFRITNSENGGGIAYTGKPCGNTGEENLMMGQDWGYQIGTYDGGQNNRAGKFTYASRAASEFGANLQPKGHGGASSGHCSHRD